MLGVRVCYAITRNPRRENTQDPVLQEDLEIQDWEQELLSSTIFVLRMSFVVVL
jgi:hypothetical protein